MSFEGGAPLDLIHREWKPADFTQNVMTVQKSGSDKDHKVQIIVQAKKKEASAASAAATPATPAAAAIATASRLLPRTTKWVSALTTYSHASDNQGLFAVTEAINTLAEGYLVQAKHELSFDHSIPLDQQLKQLSLWIKQLETLQKNLKAHDSVIKESNRPLILKDKSVAACPDHKKTEVHVNELLETLSKSKQELQERAKQKMFREIGKLTEAIQDGLPVDRRFIAERYPLFEARLEPLMKDQADECRQAYQAVVNKAYLETLIDQIETEKMTLPNSIHVGLITLGFTAQLQKRILHSAKEELIKELKDQLDSQALAAKKPIQLVKEIQTKVLEIAGDVLVGRLQKDVSPKQRMKAILAPLREMEVQLQQRFQNAFEEAMKEVDQGAKLFPDKRLKKQIQLIKHWTIVSPTHEILQTILKDLEPDLKKILDADESHFETALQKLNRTITRALEKHTQEQFSVDVLQEVIKQMQDNAHAEALKDWVDQNIDHICFPFNQGNWGSHAILGDGVCRALSYRWIKSLQANPSKKIESIEDLLGSSKQKKSVQESLLTSQDRFTQAMYGSAVSIGEIPSRWMPEFILKRDGRMLKAVTKDFDTYSSIKEIAMEIDEREGKKELDLKESQGTVDICIYSKEAGHCIGMQILKKEGIFRFWDVNLGFCEYDKLDEMVAAFDTYLRHAYPEFKEFEAVQYVPLA